LHRSSGTAVTLLRAPLRHADCIERCPLSGVSATPKLADEWFKENDPEGAAFEYEVLE
jgi:hypothetical protein